jgi:peroxiredoxin
MARVSVRCFGLAAGVAFAVLVLTGPNRVANPASAARLGKKIANVTLSDTTGRNVILYDLRDKKAIVVVFLSFECPVSTSYMPMLADMAKQYRDRGVGFLGVCPGEDDAAQVARHVRDYRVPFPVLRDPRLVAADAFQAEFTPEAFVLDGTFVLRYRGRIDNRYAARLRPNATVSRHDVRQALEELLAGKTVSEPSTQPIGCAIVREAAAKALGNTVTFHRDVLPILQMHCQSCHRPGEIGPFSLLTYKQAVRWGADMEEFTQSHKMPPWKPVGAHGRFLNERGLSEAEIQRLAQWVHDGMPEGDPSEGPPPRRFPEGWHLGQPDLVLTVPREMEVGAGGPDVYRCFVLPTGLTADRFVTAIEVQPGNRRAVHHALMFIDTDGEARKLEQAAQRSRAAPKSDHGPGYSVAMGAGFTPHGYLGGWAPGQVPYQLPDGVGYELPKGADVVLQVHYHRTGRVERDQTRIGLYFARRPVQNQLWPVLLPGRIPLFGIPAGANHYRVEGRIWIQQDANLLNVMPHMHLLGQDIRVTMTVPGGEPRLLLWIKDWDYNWQETYRLKEPLRVPTGTRFDVIAFFNNSEQNPLNPNHPPRAVRWGEQTTDEMCLVFLSMTSETPGRIRRTFRPPAKVGKAD